MNDLEKIEMLCEMQDLNKMIRFTATNDGLIKNCDDIENIIQDEFNNLYIN